MKRTILCAVAIGVMTASWVEAAAPTTTQRKMARDVIHAMGYDRNMAEAAVSLVDAEIKVTPSLGPFRDVLLKWAKSFITWDAVSEQMIDLYSGIFSELELKEMVTFYNTPTGKKVAAAIPSLVREQARIGMEMARLHTPELEAMIRQRRVELETGKRNP